MTRLEALLGKYETPQEGTLSAEDKPSVLVVDDDKSIRRGLIDGLSSRYRVTAAENGMQAVEEFRNSEFHAVVLDIKMSEMSGFEVCRELMKMNPQVPIIFYTAFQGEHDLQSILNIYRPFAYLDKGGKYDLTQTVQNAVEIYSRVLEQKRYQKDLEARLIEMGMSETKGEGCSLANIPNIIGTEKIRHQDRGAIPIKDFTTRELIGYMPDLPDGALQEALGHAREQMERWRRLTVLERLEVIAEAGRRLKEDDRFDHLIPRSGWFSRKISVGPDRRQTAEWMQKSIGYMNWAFGKERVESDSIEGLGTVGIIAQSSMFATGAYATVDALRAGNSVIVKLDHHDPYPEYLVGSTLAECGAPVQIISADLMKRPHVGRMLIDGMDKIVFMGHPQKLIELTYGEAIQQLNSAGGLNKKDIETMNRKLLMPAKVISYMASLGGAYIHRDASLDSAIEGCVYSSISHPRSCKRMKVITIHPDVYARSIEGIRDSYSRLKLGGSTDPEAEIVAPGEIFLDNHIRPYLAQARRFGKILFGDGNASQPNITEIDPESLPGSQGVKEFISRECMFPHLLVIKGDEKIALYATKLMAATRHQGMILEYSVFTSDRSLFRFIEKYGYAFNYHLNEPTTLALGNPDENRFRYHQRRVLAVDLAGTRVA